MKQKWLILTVSLMIAAAMALAGCSSGSTSGESAGTRQADASAEQDETAAETTSADQDAYNILSEVPELEPFIGGWGYQSSPTECSIASFFEENGQLKVDFASVPGGGHYAVFNPGDISFEGDVMTCENGYMVTVGGTASDARLVATPVETEPGAYFFVLSSEEANMYSDPSWDYHYLIVAQTREELDSWIDEHTPEL